uniref:Protein RER1 n=1 Tax=Coccolithus braarudii TaxID=221442 RepID=A0A7S0LBM4_9EUKA|mmetsp:Transcript_26226/g.56599  ORF Transcript_26226/g.56599 Transcript_26226/m.56599 type:complete len:188 (+) Transcript_26226:49-612(+)
MYEDVEIEEGGVGKLQSAITRKWQHWLDVSAPHTGARWGLSAFIVLIYCIRVYLINGWYIITYGLGIYVLNLLIGFLSPQVDPETEGPILPTSKDDDFRPFIRRLPEFKFWYSLTKAFVVAFTLTFFQVFNIPVFWPILLMYFIALFVLTMKRQIKHMIKFKYVPFSFGKTKYRGKEEVVGGPRSAD